MLIYFINLLSISFIGYGAYINKKGNLSKEKLAVFTWLQLCFLSAIRYNVGTDFITYNALFQDIRKAHSFPKALGISPMEWGYTALNRIIGYFTDNFVWVSAICSVLIITLIIWTCYKYSEHFSLSIYFYLTLGFLYFSYNGIRQAFALSIVFAALPFLYRREYLKYFLVVLFAALFHISILIFIPVSFIIHIKLNAKNFIISSIIIGILYILLDKLALIAIRFMPKYSIYLNTEFLQPNRNYKSILLYLLIFLSLYILKNKLLFINPINNILINFAFVALAMSIMQTKVDIFSRFVPSFAIYSILSIPQIIDCFEGNKQKRFALVTVLTIGFLFHFYQLYVGNGGVVPYQTVFGF
ncbi:EpsG family protein [Caproiciproducens sp. CPB-2]|uniref:EpsG family protein n=1 Tax=Caproiciproducens sp. CPB-2 TaxID=3030017 RepID=UPI0023DBFCBD|nr:EpsG family protein [Caproiciproducens sp. CPB-2]MDF1494089.1 EpsG family protein [Caproiciproducens sp. CPB-2]